jgi:peptidoglycan/LPS O-acetylase OafA/YrhL
VPERLNAGILVAALGALVLLVSLSLDWYEPGLSAWTVFELIDLLLAAIAILALAIAATELGGRPLRLGADRWLPALGATALVLVVVSIVDNPPAANGLSEELGAWLALAGAVLIALGAFLGQRRISIVISSSPRERSERPIAPRGPTGPATDPEGSETDTRPLGP